MHQDLHAENWKDLQDLLFTGSWDEEIHRFRSPFAFRGLSDKEYELKTRLIRLSGRYAELEKHILRNFRKYAYRAATQEDSVWKWLSVAQHYGLPTRLLDWTYSPYVALHFATVNLERHDKDGVIWCIDYIKVNDFIPQPMKEIIAEEKAHVFTTPMLNNVCQTITEFDALKQGDEDFMVFLEPPSIDDRIVNQFAFFSLMSSPIAMHDEWLKKHSDIYHRIIIQAGLKWEIRDKLDQANITERVLFPGLDGLSAWLKRHYSPRIPPAGFEGEY